MQHLQALHLQVKTLGSFNADAFESLWHRVSVLRFRFVGSDPDCLREPQASGFSLTISARRFRALS